MYMNLKGSSLWGRGGFLAMGTAAFMPHLCRKFVLNTGRSIFSKGYNDM